MHQMWRRILRAAARMQIEDMVMFYFGMGAFLRNLHQLDGRYADIAVMRRLRLRIAQGLYDAIADICFKCVPPMKVHMCINDGGVESRLNHNVFVEASAAKIAEFPEL